MKMSGNIANSVENSLFLDSISEQSAQGLNFASKDGMRAEISPPQTQVKNPASKSSRYKPTSERRRQKLDSTHLAANNEPFTPSHLTNS